MPTLQIEMHLSIVLISQPSSPLETRIYMARALASSKTVDHVPSQVGEQSYRADVYAATYAYEYVCIGDIHYNFFYP